MYESSFALWNVFFINFISTRTCKRPWDSLCLFLLQVKRHFGHYDKLPWSCICEIMTMSGRKNTSGWNMKAPSNQNSESWLSADKTSGLWELINFHLFLLFGLHSDATLSLTLKSFLVRNNFMYYVKQICIYLFITFLLSFIWYTRLQFCFYLIVT